MKYLKVKDIKNRLKYYKLENKRLFLKFCIVYFLNNYKFINKFKGKLNRVFKCSNTISKTLIKKRCILTNRSKGFVNKYSLSRIKMREYLASGIIPGYKKAVW